MIKGDSEMYILKYFILLFLILSNVVNLYSTNYPTENIKIDTSNKKNKIDIAISPNNIDDYLHELKNLSVEDKYIYRVLIFRLNSNQISQVLLLLKSYSVGYLQISDSDLSDVIFPKKLLINCDEIRISDSKCNKFSFDTLVNSENVITSRKPNIMFNGCDFTNIKYETFIKDINISYHFLNIVSFDIVEFSKYMKEGDGEVYLKFYNIKYISILPDDFYKIKLKYLSLTQMYIDEISEKICDIKTLKYLRTVLCKIKYKPDCILPKWRN